MGNSMRYGIVRKNKFLFFILMCLCVVLTSCSSTKKSDNVNNNETVTQSSHQETEIRVSEIFNSEERRIWYWLRDIAYNESIREICVLENGRVTTYYHQTSIGSTGLGITFEDLDGMTDDEIIAYLESENNIEKSEEQNLEFYYKKDDTGNSLSKEIIGGFEYFPDFFIENIIEPKTILSNKFFGFKGVSSGNNCYLISKYDFGNNTKIILNDIKDEGMVYYYDRHNN